MNKRRILVLLLLGGAELVSAMDTPPEFPDSIPVEGGEADYTFYGGSSAAPRRDTLTFSSSYFTGQHTNWGLVTSGLEILRLTVRAESYYQITTPLSLLLWRLVSFWINFSFSTGYHEIGHGLRLRAFGYGYQLHPDARKDVSFSKDENLFKFLFYRLFTLYPISSTAYDPQYTASPSPKIQCLLSAGGMNNNVYFAERLSQEIYRRQSLSFSEGCVYTLSTLYGPIYKQLEKMGLQGGDPTKVGNAWKKLGVLATGRDIERGGLIAFALSSTTYYMLYATWKSGEDVKPFHLWGFRPPDVFSYSTSKGVSYRLVSECRLSENSWVLFGGERVFHGTAATEFHVGVEKTLEILPCSWKTVFTFGEGFDLESALHIPIFDILVLKISGGIYASKSLLGERMSPNLKKEYCADAAVAIALRY
ncbi:MAG: hypothetical protein LBJ70_03975 [Holosporales bacterium]|jgi:hypothetical protein|nr:hypothetical protein [Holosporales bacterium]